MCQFLDDFTIILLMTIIIVLTAITTINGMHAVATYTASEAIVIHHACMQGLICTVEVYLSHIGYLEFDFPLLP